MNDRTLKPSPRTAPTNPLFMWMGWHDLLFAHWRVDPAALRPHVPDGFEIESFDGSAWLGVIPFRMTGIRPRGMPGLPTVSAFAELNVRTYVKPIGRTGPSGVWFFSLDAASKLGVRIARAWFGLNYVDAQMRCVHDGEWIDYESRRCDGAAEFVGRYRPMGDAFHAEPGTLKHFLVERYCLYAERRGRLLRGDIDHEPWNLHRAEATIERNTMAAPIGVELEGEPHLMFAKEIRVRAWGPVAAE